MNLKRLALAAAAGSTLFAAAPAFANPPHWAPAHGWRDHHRHYYYYRPQRVVVVPPAPYYYYPPAAPVIYGQIPIRPGVQVGFRVRL
jgi:hypothetical protein